MEIFIVYSGGGGLSFVQKKWRKKTSYRDSYSKPEELKKEGSISERESGRT
jgi:hypothetical protein